MPTHLGNEAAPGPAAVATFELIAERQIEVRDAGTQRVRSIMVRLGKPERDPLQGGDWRCPLQIQGLGDDEVFYAHGVDAFQALELGFKILGIRLWSAGTDKIVLSWLGDSNLGFPPP